MDFPIQNANTDHQRLVLNSRINLAKRSSLQNENASHFSTTSHRNNNFSLEPKLLTLINSRDQDAIAEESLNYSNMLVLPPIDQPFQSGIHKKRTSVLQIISKHQSQSPIIRERSSSEGAGWLGGDGGSQSSLQESKKILIQHKIIENGKQNLQQVNIVEQLLGNMKSKYLKNQSLPKNSASQDYNQSDETRFNRNRSLNPSTNLQTNLILQNQRVEHQKIKLTLRKILKQQDAITDMLIRIKKDNMLKNPLSQAHPQEPISQIDMSFDSLKQPPSIVNNREIYQRRRSSEIFENYNSMQQKSGNQVFPHAKQLKNTDQSVKKQGQLAELLCLSPEKGSSIQSEGSRKKRRNRGARSTLRLSQVNIESEMPDHSNHEDSEVGINIKTIEKTYRHMPVTLKKKLRQRLSMKSGCVQTDETGGIDVLQGGVVDNHFQFQPELSTEQVQHLKNLHYFYKYAQSFVAKGQRSIGSNSRNLDFQNFQSATLVPGFNLNTMGLKVNRLNHSQTINGLQKKLKEVLVIPSQQYQALEDTLVIMSSRRNTIDVSTIQNNKMLNNMSMKKQSSVLSINRGFNINEDLDKVKSANNMQRRMKRGNMMSVKDYISQQKVI